MKWRKPLWAGCLFAGLIFCSGELMAQQKSPSVPKKIEKPAEKPADFPQYRDTGNPEADKARYNSEKDAWIQANPEAYERLKQNTSRYKIKRADLEKLPVERKTHILNHPEKYEVIDKQE